MVREGDEEWVAFSDTSDRDRRMPMAEPIRAGSELAAGKVKHVRNALLLAFGSEVPALLGSAAPPAEAVQEAGRDYLRRWLRARGRPPPTTST